MSREQEIRERSERVRKALGAGATFAYTHSQAMDVYAEGKAALDRLLAELEQERAAFHEALAHARRVESEQQEAVDHGDNDGEHVGLVHHRRAVLTGMGAILAIFEAAGGETG